MLARWLVVACLAAASLVVAEFPRVDAASSGARRPFAPAQGARRASHGSGGGGFGGPGGGGDGRDDGGQGRGASGVGMRGLVRAWLRMTASSSAAGAPDGRSSPGSADFSGMNLNDDDDASDSSDDGTRARQRRRWRHGVGAVLAAGGGAAVLRRVAPRPVVLVHGVLQMADFMREVADWIHEEIPGTYVKAVEVGNGYLDSITRSMNWQSEALAREIRSDPKLRFGFNLIGYSQGSLLARAYVQRHNSPRVFNFLSWNGPQGGQFGVPDYEPLLKHLNWITSPMWYTDPLQERVSFANYWRDPFRLQLYRDKSAFLADLNNERPAAQRNETYRRHLLSLESLLLVYSTVDTIIIPRESGWFATFAENSSTELVPLEDQPLYTEDRIGARAARRARAARHAATASSARAVGVCSADECASCTPRRNGVR